MGGGIVVGRPTSFDDACLTAARFAHVDMNGSRFWARGWNVDLSHANLTGADLWGALLAEVNLDGANLRRIILPPWAPKGARFAVVSRHRASCP